MLGLAEASARILGGLSPLDAERVHVSRVAGRVLARDVAARHPLPPWPNAAMDGYAVRAADIAGASTAEPVRLRVIETVRAGAFPERALQPAEATRIMTGAPVPDGADSVVRIEDTDGGEERVLVRDARDAGKNVRARGEDVAEGAVAMHAGTIIGPAGAAMLAAMGRAYVPVARSPRVAVVSSGDELLPVDVYRKQAKESLARRQIVGSNAYAISAVIRQAGGVAIDLGIVPDDPASIRAALEDGAARTDLVVTSGGVSVGAHDHTRAVVAEIGVVEQWRIAARPGSQLAFGRIGDVPWLGLPGNPVSAAIVAELFVRAAVLRLQGARAVYPVPLAVSLAAGVARAGTTQLLRATLAQDSGGLVATLTGPQGSGRLSSIASADVLLVIPPGGDSLPAGARVAALPLRGAPPVLDRFPDVVG